MVKIEETAIHLVTEPGKNIRSAIHIEAENADHVKGEFYSDHVRIIPELDQFSGRKMRLRFGVDVTGLSDGDSVDGHLLIVTDAGERTIPVTAEVGEKRKIPAEGVRDLDDFTNLAERGPEEAFELFKSAGFEELLTEQDSDRERLLTLHQGLAVPGASSLSMEEFLLAAGKKKPVTVEADVSEVRYDRIGETVMEQVTLRRNTWGSLLILAETEGDFLSLPKSILTEEDFVGRTCVFSFLIDRRRLGKGWRIGRIRFRAPQGEFEIRVFATAGKADERDPAVQADELKLHLLREMTEWKCGRADSPSLADHLQQDIERLIQLKPEWTAPLKVLNAFALETGGRHADAQTVLRDITEKEKEGQKEEILMADEYLEGLTGLARMKREDFASRVRTCAARHPDSWLMMYLSLRTSPDIWRSGRRTIKLMRSVYEAGCRSPFLYAGALMVLRENDTLLEKLDPFVLNVLLFAARHDMLTESLLLRTAFLAENEKSFNGILFRILTEGYRKMPIDGVLEVVVRLLMKGNPRDSRCFPWYERAVARNIRVLSLYEYYVESMPSGDSRILPAVIRRYFVYSNTLSDEGRAHLYANVIRNRKDDPDTFARFLDQMKTFAYASLKAGRISPDLAVLYQTLIERLPDEESAETMTRLLFTERLYTDDPTVVRAVVVHRELKDEQAVPLIHGAALIERYTPDAQVFLEDRERRRYAVTKVYASNPLMEEGQFRELCASACPSDIGMIVSRVREFERKEIRDAEAFRTWRRAEASDLMSGSFRMEVRRKILDYILLHPENSFFTDETDRSVLADYAMSDPSRLVRVLMPGGCYHAAAWVLGAYGCEQVPSELVGRLSSGLIEEDGSGKDGERLRLATFAFRKGCVEEPVLKYLEMYFLGSLKEMLSVREKALAHSVATKELDERILKRMIFTRTIHPEGPSVFRSYVKSGGKMPLIQSYLAFYADAVQGESGRVDLWTASYAGTLLTSGETEDDAVKFLFLRAMAEKNSVDQAALSEEENLLTEKLLNESRVRGLYFRFFQDLPERFVNGLPVRDRIFIERKASAQDKVTIHYRLSTENGKKAPWQTEECERIFRGIFSRAFTLFYGETLEYYLTVIHDGTEKEDPHHIVTSSVSDLNGTGCYQRINRMLKAKADGRWDEMGKEMQAFRKARHQASVLFPIE